MKILRKMFAIPRPAALKRLGRIEAKKAINAAKKIEITDGQFKKAVKVKDAIEDARDNYNEVMKGDKKQSEFSDREKVPEKILKKAKEDGVIQKDSDGNWRIISMKSGEYWNAKYSSREKAESALSAYHANKH